MEALESIQVKIISTPKIIEGLTKDWAAQPDQVEILSSGPEEGLDSYQWGLEEAVAVLALIKGAVYLGELGFKLFKYLKDNKDKTIVVQTPLGRWEFVSRDDLTESEVKDVLTKLAGATP